MNHGLTIRVGKALAYLQKEAESKIPIDWNLPTEEKKELDQLRDLIKQKNTESIEETLQKIKENGMPQEALLETPQFIKAFLSGNKDENIETFIRFANDNLSSFEKFSEILSEYLLTLEKLNKREVKS